MLGEAEGASGNQTGDIARALQDLLIGLRLLQADAAAELALVRGEVCAGIVIQLELGQGMLAGGLPTALQAGPRLLEIEVAQHAASRPYLLPRQPLRDVIPLADAAVLRRVERHAIVARDALRRAVPIGENQGVLALGVDEEVVNAFLLEQAVHEAIVGLAILNAVVPAAIIGGEPVLKLGHRIVGEDLLDDLRHCLVLENLAVRRARKIPKPRVDTRPVISVTPLFAQIAELADQPVEVPGRAGRKLVAHVHPLAEQLLMPDGRGLAQQLQIEGERAADLLVRA